MIDHPGITVADFDARRLLRQGDGAARRFAADDGAGANTPAASRSAAMAASSPTSGCTRASDTGTAGTIAFTARSRAEVDAFHAAAIAAGGKDNGAPGLRPHYHPNYYGAFVFDPDGNNVEAVCHEPA